MQDLEILVNAPNIILLTIEGSLQLSQLMLLDVTSLVEANLDYTKDVYCTRNSTKKSQ